MSAITSRGFLLVYFALICLRGGLRSASSALGICIDNLPKRAGFLYMYLAYLINLRGEKREKKREKERKEREEKKEREERGGGEETV